MSWYYDHRHKRTPKQAIDPLSWCKVVQQSGANLMPHHCCCEARFCLMHVPCSFAPQLAQLTLHTVWCENMLARIHPASLCFDRSAASTCCSAFGTAAGTLVTLTTLVCHCRSVAAGSVSAELHGNAGERGTILYNPPAERPYAHLSQRVRMRLRSQL